MTAEELAAFVADMRRRIAENLAALAAVDPAALSPYEAADIAAARAELLDLLASMADEEIAAELEATVYARRDLMPAEVAAIRVRQ